MYGVYGQGSFRLKTTGVPLRESGRWSPRKPTLRASQTVRAPAGHTGLRAARESERLVRQFTGAHRVNRSTINQRLETPWLLYIQRLIQAYSCMGVAI